MAFMKVILQVSFKKKKENKKVQNQTTSDLLTVTRQSVARMRTKAMPMRDVSP